MVGRNDPCPCGSGKKFKKCCINIPNDEIDNNHFHPKSGAARVFQIYQEIDLISNNYLERNPHHPCKIGCSRCCSDVFLVHPEEYVLIQMGINELHDEKIQLISERTLKAYDKINKLVPDFQQIVFGTDSKKYLEKLTSKLEHIKIPCPFLIEEKCSLYSYRPSICRMYGIFHLFNESDGKVFWTSKCSKLTEPETFGVPIPKSFVDIQARLGVKSQPLPLIVWLIMNLTGDLDFNMLYKETVHTPLPDPDFNLAEIFRDLIRRGICTLPKS